MCIDFSKPHDLIGIGATPLDNLLIVNKFPKEREVQKSISSILSAGGPVSTALCTASYLGCDASLIDSLGDDIFGKYILEDLSKFKVQTNLIKVNINKTSPSSTILVEKNSGNRAIYYTHGTANELNDITPYIESITSSKIMHINGRHPNILSDAINIARQNGVIVSFDGGANRYNNITEKFARKSDICILAKDFADKYTEETDPEKALKIIIKKGALLAGITLGDRGSYLMDKNYKIIYQQAFKQKTIIDTTGCGDSYHGGILYSLVHKYSLKDSILIATAIASMNTQKLGSKGNIPTSTQLDKFLEEHHIYLNRRY